MRCRETKRSVALLLCSLSESVLASTADDLSKLLKNDVDLMKALIEKLPDVKTGRDRKADYGMEEADKSRATGASLRGLRQLLMELDPRQQWGGLKKTLTPEGHWPGHCRSGGCAGLAPACERVIAHPLLREGWGTQAGQHITEVPTGPASVASFLLRTGRPRISSSIYSLPRAVSLLTKAPAPRQTSRPSESTTTDSARYWPSERPSRRPLATSSPAGVMWT